MLKVLIADDEPYVREGLKNIIPWSEYNFTICGLGTDGDDTYDKICLLKPDLVLIDINMPGKSGLDVIKDCLKNNFKCKFIIVSGYSDFKYAKVAIKYGVKSYLLKPIDEDELLYIVINQKKEIEEEYTNINKLETQKKFVKEYALVQLILGKKVDYYNELINTLNYTSYQVVLISSCNDKVKGENLINLENCISNKLLNTNNVDICKIKNKVALIFYDTNPTHVVNILNRLKTLIDKTLCCRTFITLGHLVDNIDKIPLSYNNAEYLMSKRFLFLDHNLISDLHLKEIQSNSNLNELELLNKIYTYVEIGEIQKIEELLKELENILKSKLYTEEKVKVLITKSYLEFKQIIESDYELSNFALENSEKAIEEIYNKDSLSDTIKFINNSFCNISRIISMTNSDKSIKRIIKYIEKNYYKDLKLESLAEFFNYNSAYLGKIFKSYTGTSFNTYVDKIRIEQAKKLLLEDKLKVYQISEKVGYKNIDYFHSKFKKYVGISPLNYKKTLESSIK